MLPCPRARLTKRALAMRLRLAVPVLAGFLFGWTALAQATDAPPPAAPIFYCPTPAKAAPAPAATADKSTGHAVHAVRASGHRRQSCPTLRVAAVRHHRHGHGPAPKMVANNDVSASQAFIYRYERAVHGLDARAADEAWAEGRRPPCPPRRDHCPGGGMHDDGMHGRGMHDGDMAMMHAGPPPEGPALAQRAVPPPPCPQQCPGPGAWRDGGPRDLHDGAANGRAYAERALAPPVEPPPPPPREAPPPPIAHGYAWQDGHGGYRYDEREDSSERAGGWSYSEVDGHARYHHWGDRFGDEPDAQGDGRRSEDHWGQDHWDQDHWGGDRWTDRPRRCPPPVPASACAAGQSPHHADVAVAGRDAAGYLTWPGKTE